MATGLVFFGIIGSSAAMLIGSFFGKVRTVKTVVVAAVILTVAAVAIRPYQSRDLYAYAMYGRIVSHYSASPYTHTPREFSTDRSYPRVKASFRNDPSVYGPIFTGLSAAGMAAAGDSALLARLWFQLLAALSLLGSVAIVARLRPGDVQAVAFVGLNPLLLASVVNGGHVDAIAGVAMLGAIAVITRNRWLCGVLLGCAVAVKATALLPAAAIVLWIASRRGMKTAAQTAFSAIALLAVAYAIGGGTPAIRAVQHGALLHITDHSIWQWPLRWWGASGKRTIITVGAVAGAIGGAVAAVAHRNDPSAETPATAAYTTQLMAAAYVLPWYGAIMLPSAALAARDKLSWILMGYSTMIWAVYPSSGGIRLAVAITVVPALTLAGFVWLVGSAIKRLSNKTEGAEAPSDCAA
ncbi:MAG: hypothetical protein NVSMB57_03530 [Actinomycetota bacterium]